MHLWIIRSRNEQKLKPIFTFDFVMKNTQQQPQQKFIEMIILDLFFFFN